MFHNLLVMLTALACASAIPYLRTSNSPTPLPDAGNNTDSTHPPPATISGALGITSALEAMASAYYERKEYPGARAFLVRVVAIRRRWYGGIDHPDIARSLGNMGMVLNRMRNYAGADSSFSEALEIVRRRPNGFADSTLALHLGNLGEFRMSRGDLAGGLPLIEEALKIQRRLHPADHLDLARALNRMGRAYAQQHNYQKAEKLYEDALAMYRRLYHKIDRREHAGHAAALRGAGLARYGQGDYPRAGFLFMHALRMNRRLFPGDIDPALAESIVDVASYYIARGNHAAAEPYIEEGVAMYRSLYPDVDDPGLARSLSWAGAYYHTRGDLKKAGSFYEEALAMRRRLHGKSGHPDLAESIGAMGSIREDLGDSAGAEAFHDEALKMQRDLHAGEDHRDLAATLSAMGEFYANHGDYPNAEQLFKDAARIHGRLSEGKDHPGLAKSICNMAIVHGYRRKHASSDSLFGESLAMYGRLYKETRHPDILLDIYTIARFAEKFGYEDRARKAYEELLRILPQITRASTLFEGEEQQIRFQTRLTPAIDAMSSFFLRHRAAGDLYDATLRSKGRILEAVEWRNRVLMELGSSDTGITRIRESYLGARSFLSDTKAPADSSEFDRWFAEHERLHAEVERMEGVLTRRGSELRRSRKRVSWRSIQRRLCSTDAVIEFVRIPYSKGTRPADSVIYCALVLRKKYAEPRLVRLCEEGALEEILRAPVERREFTSYIHDASRGHMLYELAWKPIDSLLAGARSVYISPDGLLNRVAFGVLKDNSARNLFARYDIRYLFSSRDLVPRYAEEDGSSGHPKTAAIFGGVRYDAAPGLLRHGIVNLRPKPEPSDLSDESDSPARHSTKELAIGTPLAQLHGTVREAAEIADLLKHHIYTVTSYTDTDATEEEFLRLHSPTILHVATHGYFFPDPQLSPGEQARMQRGGGIGMIRYGENPLLRSGLLFAGANRVWTLQPPSEGIGDGVVTAYDVAHMNLSRTELVVLSACETGLGDIRGGEGVFGLKRAFRAAGAEAVMMSLWKVPDEQTRDLMRLFYTNWLDKNKGKAEALAEAQREMAKQYSDPYYWGAFVLVGE